MFSSVTVGNYQTDWHSFCHQGFFAKLQIAGNEREPKRPENFCMISARRLTINDDLMDIFFNLVILIELRILVIDIMIH